MHNEGSSKLLNCRVALISNQSRRRTTLSYLRELNECEKRKGRIWILMFKDKKLVASFEVNLLVIEISYFVIDLGCVFFCFFRMPGLGNNNNGKNCSMSTVKNCCWDIRLIRSGNSYRAILKDTSTVVTDVGWIQWLDPRFVNPH